MKLNTKYERQQFMPFMKEFLPNDFTPKEEDIVMRSDRYKEIKSATILGYCESLDLFVLELDHSYESDPRVAITTDAFKILADNWIHNALIIFKNNRTHNYRLSYLTISLDLNDKNKVIKSYSNARRYSFYLGEKAKIKTPEQQLLKRGKAKSTEDLLSRFSIEVVNNEFYNSIAALFDALTGPSEAILNNIQLKIVESLTKVEFVKKVKSTKYYKIEPLITYPSDGNVFDFSVRLIGRVIFCWFLKEKHSKDGIPLISSSLLSTKAIENDEMYYHSILSPLFFEVLNKPLKKRAHKFAENDFAKVPYLNGGLFTPDPKDYYSPNNELGYASLGVVDIPKKWLLALFNLLELYNFTVDENTSFDVELSIDPEMLGRVFESLLARINPETGETARKATGSFYTPREIVDHMVDESLIQYLLTNTKIGEAKIRTLVSYDLSHNKMQAISDQEKKEVLEKLGEVKILDPACGSGAFPIGILQKMVFILEQVDPDSELWLERQLQGASIELKHLLEREFRNKNFTYLRKLGVLRESIFGVDIQQIATEISRLRCFLTLVVDQSVDDHVENRGIEPLPNLEFKFVTANSLLGLEPDAEQSYSQTVMFEDDAGISSLKQLRDEYFNSHGNERNEVKYRFKEAQTRMLQNMFLESRNGISQITQKLALWNPFSNERTEWFDPEWMFGIKQFNIVIGNPPYFVYEGNSNSDELKVIKKIKLYEKAKSGKLNAYKLFLIKSASLLLKDGTLCEIFQNSFLADQSAKEVRKYFLSENQIIVIDSFPERDDLSKRVFESVKMSVCILLAKKGFHNEYNFILRVWEERFMKNANQVVLNTELIRNFDSINFVIPSIDESEKELFFSIYQKHKHRIRDVCNFYRGELNMTTDRKYFTSIKNEYLALKGAQVQKYFISSSPSQGKTEYVLKDDYTSEKAGEKSKHYLENRIVLQRITGVDESYRIKSAFLDRNTFCADSCNYIPFSEINAISSKLLLALLNSALINWMFKKTSTNSNVNGYEIENLPIPLIGISNQLQISEIEGHVDQIHKLITSDSLSEIIDFEAKIDQLVFDLYGLTKEEKELVLQAS